MLAYLVIREGSKWTDVFRLVEGRTVTIGRAPTNQIVIKDERCSRHHAEIFLSEGEWILRDLDSRNGTLVGEQRVIGDHTLAAGEIVRIALAVSARAVVSGNPASHNSRTKIFLHLHQAPVAKEAD